MKFKNIASPVKKTGRQLGVSLLEVLGSIAVGAVVMVGVVDQTNRYIDNTKDAYTAEHARMYAAAARAYVKENIDDKTKIKSAANLVNQTDLVRYLPAGFGGADKNPYGQTPQVVLKRLADKEVEGYLVYTGGTPIPDGRRQFVSVMTGIGGGFVGADSVPQGAGWSDSKYQASFGAVRPLETGRPVVSLSLLSPVDPKDCRYLSIDPPNGICGAQLNRDLDMGNFGIKATSLTNVENITGGNGKTINIVGATSFSNTVTVTSSVTIGGAVSATGTISGNAFSPGMKVALGASCVGYSLGTIAQLSTTVTTDKGSLLSCQLEKSTDEKSQSWRPFLSASEEKLAIIGCWAGNDYCKKTPEEICKSRDKDPGDGVTKCDFKYEKTKAGSSTATDGRDGIQYWWQNEIGERTFCALGFHAQTQSTLAAKEDGTTVTGAPNHTFCRVFPERKDGRDTWYIKVGSAYKTPVSCHAVCLNGL